MNFLNVGLNQPKHIAPFSGIFGCGCVCFFSNPGSTTAYCIPSGVYCIRVRLWGAAGGSCVCCYNNYPNSCDIRYGGSGGGFAMKTMSVTPGCCCPITVGCAGICCCNGGTSSFGIAVCATGGSVGFSGPPGTGSGGDINNTGGCIQYTQCCCCSGSWSYYTGGGNAANYFGNGSNTRRPSLISYDEIYCKGLYYNLDAIGTGGICFGGSPFNGAGADGSNQAGSFPGGGPGGFCFICCASAPQRYDMNLGHGLVIVEW